MQPSSEPKAQAEPQTSLENASAPSPSQQSPSSPSSPSSPEKALRELLESTLPVPTSSPRESLSRSRVKPGSWVGRGFEHRRLCPRKSNQLIRNHSTQPSHEPIVTLQLRPRTRAFELLFMDHPVKEISGVVRTLCQGTPQEQQDALYANFLPNASFVHPFCRVPGFSGLNVPFFGELNSRIFILGIFKWYKVLSPKIDIEIESHVFDQRAGLLYLTICQTFAIWFIPFYRAPVRLVTVLQLKQCQIGDDGEIIQPSNGQPTNGADSSQGGPSSLSSSSGDLKNRNNHANSSSGAGHNFGRTRYMIASQEDLYQVNEFLKFISFGLGAPLWAIWQMFSTLICAIGALIGAPVIGILQRYRIAPQQQKMA